MTSSSSSTSPTGVDEETGAAAVNAVTEQFSAPDPMTRDEYLDFVGDEVDQMLTFVYGLLGIAVADRAARHRQHAVAVDPRAAA